MNVGGFLCLLGCLGVMARISCCSRCKNSDCSVLEVFASSSPGRRSGSPYKSSADEQPTSSLVADRSPSNTSGSASTQTVGRCSRWHLSAALMVRCCRSMRPLACGWYAVVVELRNPRYLPSERKSSLSNCLPWSVVILVGIPNRANQVAISALATESAVWSVSEIASTQRV